MRGRIWALAAAVAVTAGCGGDGQGNDRMEDRIPGATEAAPATTAPGVAPGTEPIPSTPPGVIQEDTLEHPGAPGPDARPGI
jgi:hypothetical protein